ncbi:response regulator transcription factor [Baekduia soli]|nr:response regulator transcription factor [Baekduia soli]
MLHLKPDDPATVSDLRRPWPTGMAAARPRTIRLVVADDHPLYREGIIRALDAHGGFLVIGEAGDGATALSLIRSLEPTVALLDVRMPILDGVDVITALSLHGPDVPVILLSAFSDRQLVASGLEAGAAAYIDKTEDRDAICLQLATIAASPSLLAPRQLRPTDPMAGGHEHWMPRLTRQEHQVLQLAGKGMDKVEIAQTLGVAESEIRRRASEVLRKLDVDSLDTAVARGRTLRLIR